MSKHETTQPIAIVTGVNLKGVWPWMRHEIPAMERDRYTHGGASASGGIGAEC